MSASRQAFLADIAGIRSALALDPLATGAVGTADPPAVIVLRRGILIAALIAFETFVRQRCIELLAELQNWPADYDDLPTKFRESALLHALPNLHSYAKMMKRQGDDYQKEIVDEIKLASGTNGPVYGFTRHMVGDLTGNISADSLKELLSSFCVRDCWNTFRLLSADTGFGVPSVEEILKGLVRKRHRSAHVAGFSPSLNDTQSLPKELTCLGFCFDAAMTASLRRAIHSWQEWKDNNVVWRSHVHVYFVDKSHQRYRLLKLGRTKALRLADSEADAASAVPATKNGEATLVVFRDQTLVPYSWSIN